MDRLRPDRHRADIRMAQTLETFWGVGCVNPNTGVGWVEGGSVTAIRIVDPPGTHR